MIQLSLSFLTILQIFSKKKRRRRKISSWNLTSLNGKQAYILRAALGCNIDISHAANFRYERVTQKVRKKSLLSLKKFHKGNHIDHALLNRITKPTNDRNPTRRRIKNVESLITPKGTKILLLYIKKTY